jgi:asparagine synthase (glutamine-hydrolysing)
VAICGIAGREDAVAAGDAIARSLDALSLGPEWKRKQLIGREFAVGITSAIDPMVIGVRGPITVCCDADLWNAADLLAKADVPEPNIALAIAALYERMGEGILHELRGAFSLAVWDSRDSRLLIAVDPMGIRPLVYSANSEQICFASQPRGIFATGRFGREVDYQAISSYLTFTVVPAPQTAFRNVHKMEPGTLLHWSRGILSRRRYWDIVYPEDARESTDTLATRLLDRMKASVAASAHGIDVGRLGSFLSGGTDSSSVVGLLTQLTAAPVNTFSIGFEEEAFNELRYAHIAVKHFGARHHEAKISAALAFETVNQVVDAYDEPFGNASIIPTYHCLRLAREAGMTTMLAGDGGDELFGGNERYRTDQLYQIYLRLPDLARKTFEPLLFRMPDFLPQVARAKRYVNACNQGNPERYCAWLLPCRYRPEDLLGPAVSQANGSDVLAVIRRHFVNAQASSDLNRLLYVDVKMTLGDNDLPKVTRAAEMLGIRVRFPYLDTDLAEFTGSLPANLKVRGLEKRYLFKKATAKLLPREILAKKKHGFGLPVGFWLKTDPRFRSLARDVLLDSRTYQRGYFRRPFVERLFDQLEADDGVYFGDSLWLFLMLELWHRKHVEVTPCAG